MSRAKHFLLGGLTFGTGVLLFALPGRGQCSPSGLDDGPLEATCGTIEFDCFYTDDDPVGCNASGDYFTEAQAQDVLDAVDSACGLYSGFGFASPHQNTLPDFFIYIYDLDDAGLFGNAYASCFRINSVAFRCDADDGPLRKTSQHELFHTIQRKYMCVLPDNDCDDDDTSVGTTFGKWVSEGTARCLDDRLYADLDSATFGGSFWDEANETMPLLDTPLADLSYNACLFWSYCCEQLGDDVDEPERGIDFIKSFWERIEANATNDSFTALRQTITAEGGTSLDDVFQDYAICNYTKDYDVSALPNSSRYSYIDEGQDGQADYGSVPADAVAVPSNDTDTVSEYAIRYFEAEVNGPACQAVGFRAESDAEVLGWALTGVTGDGRATVLSKGQGTEWGRTVILSPTDPVDKIAAVVAGFSNGDDFEYWFDSGDLTVSIFRPTSARQATPGPAGTPGRFLARVFVEGPADLEPAGIGQRSVMGLQKDDFSVTVGAEPATVLSTAYVGGEYWLVVQAPGQAADGSYDLTVSLCDGGVSDTSDDAVLYATLKTNHVVVIDRSGSMANPAGNTKLDAAKIAGGLYVDSVSDGDRIGIVAFDGNTIACDDDAVVLEALGDATAAKRTAARADIDALVAGGWTSIGDGLWKGQDQLDLFLADADYHTMVLLSDGEENEARYWDTPSACDTAASRIAPEDTVVNAIAFGPESNQTLMQDIADQTEGDYSYVDVSLARTAGLSMINSLADAYMGGLQRARRLERLFFRTGTTAGTAFFEFDIPVTEAGLEEATFFFNVASRTANLTVELRNPGGVLIGAGAARIYATPAHKVYHMFAPPMPGIWRARLSTTEPVEYIAGLIARHRLGAQMIARVTQVRQGGITGEADEGLFESGVPVTLLAVLTDAQGPILGAQVQVEIEQPDGDLGCGPHLLRDDGTQNDGAAHDGVYGLVFTGTWRGSRGGVNNDSTQQPPPGTRGSYGVTFHALGVTTQGVPFERWADRGFQVYASTQDQDQDQLPDAWEKFYGTNPTIPDATLDQDLDGLGARQEFEQGTHPLDPDTDDDGELDGSEFNRGRCPLDPADGLLPAPLGVEVVTDPGDEGSAGIMPYANLLRFPWHPAYQQLRIFRAVDAPAGFVLHQTLGALPGRTGRFSDAGLTAGRAYFYQFQAVGAGGATSRRSRIVQGVPFGVQADCDNDGDVDLVDVNTQVSCLTGPVSPIGTGCTCADLVPDGHVDLRDAAALQVVFPYP